MREIADFYKMDGIDFKPGDVIVDVGAHVGVVSLYLANKYPDIQVYAYEPVPSNFKRLLRNIEANKIENVVAVNKAVTSDGRNIELYGDIEKSSGGISMYEDSEIKIEAESVTLKQIFEEHKIIRCKLLKIDCEGAEYEILKSSSETLNQVDHMRGEFHHIEGESIDDLVKFCEGFIDDVVITREVGNEKKKSNDRGGQKTVKQLSGGGIHNREQRKKKSNRSKRRRKNR
jgi:FkbM family methyltransferase